MRVNATPPNPPTPLSEHIIPDWKEHFLRSLAWPSVVLRVRRHCSLYSLRLIYRFQTMYWLVGAIEILVILASYHPSRFISNWILGTFILNGSPPSYIEITPLFVLGHALSILGTALRLYSFRTLGRMFTFELCIHKDHELIVTGPYAFIRHPSYTGLILTIMGAYCNHISGSWVKECGILDTVTGRALVLIWLTIAGSVIASLLLRVPAEDRILKMRFGEEWDIWARNVRYKFIPGIY